MDVATVVPRLSRCKPDGSGGWLCAGSFYPPRLGGKGGAVTGLHRARVRSRRRLRCRRRCPLPAPYCRPAAAADPAGGRAVDPEAHARFVGRGVVRALAGEPVLPVLLRRIELLPPTTVRPLVADTLAPAAGRGALGRVAPGEPVGGAQDRGAGDP